MNTLSRLDQRHTVLRAGFTRDACLGVVNMSGSVITRPPRLCMTQVPSPYHNLGSNQKLAGAASLSLYLSLVGRGDNILYPRVATCGVCELYRCQVNLQDSLRYIDPTR